MLTNLRLQVIILLLQLTVFLQYFPTVSPYLDSAFKIFLYFTEGHSWSRIKLKGSPEGIRWQTVTSEAVFEGDGQVWLLSANGDLFCSQPYNNKNLKVSISLVYVYYFTFTLSIYCNYVFIIFAANLFAII